MDYQTIREARLREPFRPFRLRTTAGQVFHITRPEYLAVSSRAVGILDGEDGGGYAFQPAEIEALEYEDQKSTSAP